MSQISHEDNSAGWLASAILSLSFSPSLRPRLYCLDASSMREFSPFLLASSRPSPFLPPFHVSPGYARRRAPLSAPLREDINRGILNRFEDRNIPPPLVRNVEIFFRLLLSPVFFFVADTIRHFVVHLPVHLPRSSTLVESTSKSSVRLCV